MVTWFEVGPVIGITRFADRHEVLAGVHFLSRDKKCLLDSGELLGLIKFLEVWLHGIAGVVPDDGDRPRLQRIRHAARSGLAIEWNDRPGPAIAIVTVASPVIIGLTGKELEKLLRELQRLQAFLEEVREA